MLPLVRSDPRPAAYADIPDINGSEGRGAHGTVFNPAPEDLPRPEDKIIPQGVCPFPYRFVNRVEGKGAENHKKDKNYDMGGKGRSSGSGSCAYPKLRANLSEIFH
jgi:hypothetical protein